MFMLLSISYIVHNLQCITKLYKFHMLSVIMIQQQRVYSHKKIFFDKFNLPYTVITHQPTMRLKLYKTSIYGKG